MHETQRSGALLVGSFIRCSSYLLFLLFFLKDYDKDVVRSKRGGEGASSFKIFA
jgi:hypothetical protein